MSRPLRFRFNEAGTKFWLYPQPGLNAEIVYINAAPGTITTGPKDHRIYVIDAKEKKPYKKTGKNPPYKGPHRDPATPDRHGHFNIQPGELTFRSATVFATVRCVLDVWEHHLERTLRWYFQKPNGPLLEVIPTVNFNNAHSYPGYLEFGYPDFPRRSHPFCENFDSVAHETGHLIMKSVMGNPPDDEKSLQYRAHEEAAADLIAMLAPLHFDSLVRDALDHTKGKLFSIHKISRISEWGPTKDQEIRRVFNDATMSSIRQSSPLTKHDLSLPFSGAAYDVFVEIYESNLVERAAICSDLAKKSRHAPRQAIPDLQTEFAAYFAKKPADFTGALLDARDYFARLLARTWASTRADRLLYPNVAANMIAADTELSKEVGKAPYTSVIRESFEAREIFPSN